MATTEGARTHSAAAHATFRLDSEDIAPLVRRRRALPCKRAPQPAALELAAFLGVVVPPTYVDSGPGPLDRAHAPPPLWCRAFHVRIAKRAGSLGLGHCLLASGAGRKLPWRLLVDHGARLRLGRPADHQSRSFSSGTRRNV